MPGPAQHRWRTRRGWRWLVPLVAAGIAVAGCSSGSVSGGSTPQATSGTPATASSPAGSATASTGPYCPELVVPAYFYSSSVWAQAYGSNPAPENMILDISGTGAGDAPDAHFASLVRAAKAKGVTVLGYISTVDGQRPLSEVEQEVRNYKSWYGVTSIFLDRVSGQQAQLSYYQQMASYIHGYNRGSAVWMNPGIYPDQAYMSVGDVVMVFEGTYAQYVSAQVPSWASDYPSSKFAHTIYDTPSSSLASALKLAQSRNAGHVYITDASGDNPYDVLPSYWAQETSAANTSGCSG
jgi:Spherulation-specific family 4